MEFASIPEKTVAVQSFPSNPWGLYDMPDDRGHVIGFRVVKNP